LENDNLFVILADRSPMIEVDHCPKIVSFGPTSSENEVGEFEGKALR
jgi:hypothetical protein